MQPGYARDYALASNDRGSHRDGQIGAKSQAQRYPSDAPLVKRGGRANKPNQVLLVQPSARALIFTSSRALNGKDRFHAGCSKLAARAAAGASLWAVVGGHIEARQRLTWEGVSPQL